MLEVLERLAAKAGHFVELRYHRKETRRFEVELGRLENAIVYRRSGVGVRVLERGTWGVAATSDLSDAAIAQAIEQATIAARASADFRKVKVAALPVGNLARGRFATAEYAALYQQPLEAKMELALAAEARAREISSHVETARSNYQEIFEEKAIVTSDGAACELQVVRSEFAVNAVAARSGTRATYSESSGATGGWDCVFRDRDHLGLAERAAQLAVDLSTAPAAPGGRFKVILAPSIVGLLAHEAIGHTVEADFVQAGSVAAGKLKQRVASELITLCDSGNSEFYPGASGTIAVDDEGVPTRRTVIIRQGILESYLHNRESAAHFEVAPTGNARAWEYADEPLIRMRNTYIEPGDASLAEMIAGIGDGFLLEGPLNGQADATGEFMFAVARAQRIRNGKLAELVRGATVSGVAFEVLQSVDAVSREFKWDMGTGYCGKGQRMKVDAGGPYLRCEVLLGGQR
ncbi:MAG: TldD/PmbA family protein [Cyanobacteria bacterium NC_groundwater_1444_Ag_S-0.65um_54_12]|nr:TldD/PmbA family protein [Cyanobacteria bacterium NC_groundwater_1444_Ag_S-0.65um_54_12]